MQDTANGDCGASLLVTAFVARLAIALRHIDLFDVVDLAGQIGGNVPYKEPDFTLNVTSTISQSDFFVALMLQRLGDRQSLWGNQFESSHGLFDKKSMASTVAAFADQIAISAARSEHLFTPERLMSVRLATDAVHQMMSLSSDNLALAYDGIRSAIEIEERGIYLAWAAFLTAFFHENGKGAEDLAFREEADRLTSRFAEIEPFNPLGLSLLSHVHGFVFRDLARARELVSPVANLVCDSPMYHDNLAMLAFYTGDLNEARESALKAANLGVSNPYRYSFSTSLCMIEAVDRHYDRAIFHGERALAMQARSGPVFEPALRYLCASYAHSGDLKNAERLQSQITNQHPDFSLEMMKDASYPVPNQEAREFLLSGFSQLNWSS